MKQSTCFTIISIVAAIFLCLSVSVFPKEKHHIHAVYDIEERIDKANNQIELIIHSRKKDKRDTIYNFRKANLSKTLNDSTLYNIISTLASDYRPLCYLLNIDSKHGYNYIIFQNVDYYQFIDTILKKNLLIYRHTTKEGIKKDFILNCTNNTSEYFNKLFQYEHETIKLKVTEQTPPDSVYIFINNIALNNYIYVFKEHNNDLDTLLIDTPTYRYSNRER